jgi:hypothetical protein
MGCGRVGVAIPRGTVRQKGMDLYSTYAFGSRVRYLERRTQLCEWISGEAGVVSRLVWQRASLIRNRLALELIEAVS